MDLQLTTLVHKSRAVFVLEVGWLEDDDDDDHGDDDDDGTSVLNFMVQA